MPRPAVVTVFGILNIVLGAFVLLTTFFRVYLVLRSANDAHSIEMATLHPYYVLWTKVSLSLRFLASLAMIASGFGLLHLKPWARNVSIGYAVYGIVVGIIGIYTFCTFALPSVRALTTARGHPDPFVATTATYAGLLGCCMSPVYPALLLVFALTGRFATAFRRPAPPPPIASI